MPMKVGQGIEELVDCFHHFSSVFTWDTRSISDFVAGILSIPGVTVAGLCLSLWLTGKKNQLNVF